ncbi:hypothetical protein BH683_010315 [Williamsia sp. 1138]|uniref:acyltransferase family protein n=1 Tax=Williamsia sp. 1138 TaxID=1903117 RepID=UPI000A10F1F2|nr:acyltransferase family protein [Williamsia sp. 1138]OZG29324.1 hypothetical protein BH683_010315 [Williamsia sp. 1138]
MPRPVESDATYLPALDGIRALAVAFVVLYHLGVPGFTGGLLGVGVFFTLSGYLITSILISGKEKTSKWHLGTFWIKRLRRLLPAVVLVLAATLVAAAFAQPRRVGEYAWQALSSLGYVNNWHNIIAETSYFDRFGPPSPLGHMWSLSIEEQFYLLWPLVLAAMFFVVRRRALITVATVALALVSFYLLYDLSVAGFDNTRAYEGTDTRAGGLLVGAAVAMWWPARSTTVSHNGRCGLDVAALVGLVTVVVLVTTMPDGGAGLYTYGIALLSLATAAVLIAAVVPATLVATVLGLTPLRWIGERSYGIYLWHMPLIAFTPMAFRAYSRPISSVVIIVATVVLAALSWRFVENPIRTHGFAGAWRLGVERERPLIASLVDKLIAALERLRAPRVRRQRWSIVGSCALVLTLAAGAMVGLSALNTDTAFVNALPGSGPATTSMNALPVAPVSAVPEKVSTGPTVPIGQRRTECATVIHVGDSTSVGMISEETLPDPITRVPAQYERVGATTVITDISGARSSLEEVAGEPNAVDAIKGHIARGESGCWVMAMGINDTANVVVGGLGPVDMRIDRLLKPLGDQPVLWPTVRTTELNANPAYDNGEMEKFNLALLRACERYPNLRLYDWAAEADPAWFTDGIHYTAAGYTERGRRFATALATAFPATDHEPAGCVVRADA